MDEWISQGEQDAQLSKKIMLLVIKLNNKGTFVCLDAELMGKDYENYFKYGKYLVLSLENFISSSKNINILKEYFESIGEKNV